MHFDGVFFEISTSGSRFSSVFQFIRSGFLPGIDSSPFFYKITGYVLLFQRRVYTMQQITFGDKLGEPSLGTYGAIGYMCKSRSWDDLTTMP